VSTTERWATGPTPETHVGQFFDFPASGNHVSINGVDILTVQGVIVQQCHVEQLAILFGSIVN